MKSCSSHRNIGKIKSRCQVVYIVLILGVFPEAPHSEEINTVEAEGQAVVHDGVTLTQAKFNALNQARANAIETAAGTTTQRYSVVKDQLLVVDFIKSFARGMIVEESPKRWRGDWLTTGDGDPGFPVVKVQFTAKVVRLSSSYLKSGVVKARLNKKIFANDDDLHLSAEFYKDAFWLAANYTSKGTVIPLFPNRYDSDNSVKAGQNAVFPRPGSQHPPLKVRTFPNHRQDIEAIIVLALPVNEITENYTWEKVFPPGIELNYADYFGSVANLPLEWISEKILVYTVTSEH